jgi:hypothetical protein
VTTRVGYDAGAAVTTPSVDLGRTDLTSAGALKEPTLSPGRRLGSAGKAATPSRPSRV